ncbi:uncharacterized protein LOC108212640 [Daucus carota subsp. sativus]|uniref:uncharacterized protein LOC108212640 n=1 Tax=Daucus carota subsp. sativus TaxID=79200 RepID=UPI0030833F57
MVEIESNQTPNQSSSEQTQQSPLTQQTSQTNPLQSSSHRILDPYLIHPSDNPTTCLVSPQLEGDNYATWTRGMTKALNAKGKLGFVDGNTPPPASDLPLLNCWKRCDDLVSSWIIHSVHPDLRSSLMYADSARTIWNDLKVRFSQSNAPQLYHLKTAIINLKQADMSVTNYFTRLKSLWDEYDSLVSSEPCICGASKFLIERQERDRAMEFLQGLHDRFSNIRSQILLIEPLPSAQKIFNLVKQEEAQQFIAMPPALSTESAALQARGNPPQRHSFNKRQRPYCDHCNKYGHTRQTCYQIHGFPPSKPKGTAPISTVAAVTSTDKQEQPVLPSLSADQYNRLLSMLSTPNIDDDILPKVNLTGPTFEPDDWSG